MQESKDVLNYEKMHSIDKKTMLPLTADTVHLLRIRRLRIILNMSIFIQLLILCIRMRSDG